jgi:hypothetical protein
LPAAARASSTSGGSGGVSSCCIALELAGTTKKPHNRRRSDKGVDKWSDAAVSVWRVEIYADAQARACRAL